PPMAPTSEEGVSAAEGLAALARLADERAPRVLVYGCRGAFQAQVVARLAGRGPRPLVLVTPTEAAAVGRARDLAFFLPRHHAPADPVGAPRVMPLPHLETTPWADVSPDRRAILRRMATLFRLSQGLGGEVLVASAPSLARRVVPRAAFAD